MNKTAYKIFDILARRLGDTISINEVRKNIDSVYGKAYYADIYEKVKSLSREGTVTLAKSGRSSLISLNFENYMIVDMLAEIELRRKQDFLKEKQEMQMLLLEIDTCLYNIHLISFALLMYPEKNTKLNKTEILICLKESSNRKAIQEAKITVHTIMETLQHTYNIRVDYLTLENTTFLALLKSNDCNTVREMLHNKIAIRHPQDFWLAIKNTAEQGVKISSIQCETNPAKISEDDLVFNLARFGYSEIGSTVKQGNLFCIEYVIASIMFHNDARRVDAIPVIIAKSSKISYDLLLFLARKYGFGGKILGMLRTLQNLGVHSMNTIDEPIRLLEVMKIKEIKTNANNIKAKLRLYNVT